MTEYEEYKERLKARSWGRGGRGTIGWSGVQPMDGESNVIGNPSGWCHVIGDCMPGDTNFNNYNIRDISFRNDTITLETFCYKIFDKLNDNTLLGWFPCPPDSVIFRYTIWGVLDTTLGINDNEERHFQNTINCKAITKSGDKNVIIEYTYEKLEDIEVFVYNSSGKLIQNYNIIFQKSIIRNQIIIDFSNNSKGAYYVVLRANSNFGYCNFIYLP